MFRYVQRVWQYIHGLPLPDDKGISQSLHTSSTSAEKPQSPKRRPGASTGERSSHRKSILQRSRTINHVPENCNSDHNGQQDESLIIHLSNGRDHNHSSVGFNHDQVSNHYFNLYVWLSVLVMFTGVYPSVKLGVSSPFSSKISAMDKAELFLNNFEATHYLLFPNSYVC